MMKHRKTKCSYLATKEAEVIQWNVLCIYLIGPYKFKQPPNQTQTLWDLTITNPITGWFPAKEAEVKPWSVLCINLIYLSFNFKQPNNQTQTFF